MSSHLAVATVTAVLRESLQNALDSANPQVAGARVTTTRPNAPQADLPTRAPTSFSIRPPRARRCAAPISRPGAATAR